jgi:hypothetical protein
VKRRYRSLAIRSPSWCRQKSVRTSEVRTLIWEDPSPPGIKQDESLVEYLALRVIASFNDWPPVKKLGGCLIRSNFSVPSRALSWSPGEMGMTSISFSLSWFWAGGKDA